MTEPAVPLRASFTVEVPGTPEQVWAALATSDGLSAWFQTTEVDGRPGGTVLTHMGDSARPATITSWEPPSRLVYEEEGWAVLGGQPEDAPVSALRSEFLVQARSGDTCVVTVVSSAYGTGADWEAEFMTEMADGWAPFFENLKVYLREFAGQTATPLEVVGRYSADPYAAWDAVVAEAGDGDVVAVAGLRARVHLREVGAVLGRLEQPAPGLMSLHAYRAGAGGSIVVLRGWLFGPDAAAVAEREQPAWQEWLDGLRVGAPV